ncbi:hypothetical protein AB4Z42_01305 [Mycobacterium sp. 2YAF39]|uniref:hypothetical protein n=1 Tax=Mycobacterium sp. 2YAF39 TaxID=3233033 RepID=UPI003F998A86
MPLVTRTLDLSTRYFWRVVGRPVDIAGVEGWLDSPTNAIEARGDDWLDVLDEAGRVRASNPNDGLLPAFSALEGPDFSPGRSGTRFSRPAVS